MSANRTVTCLRSPSRALREAKILSARWSGVYDSGRPVPGPWRALRLTGGTDAGPPIQTRTRRVLIDRQPLAVDEFFPQIVERLVVEVELHA